MDDPLFNISSYAFLQDDSAVMPSFDLNGDSYYSFLSGDILNPYDFLSTSSQQLLEPLTPSFSSQCYDEASHGSDTATVTDESRQYYDEDDYITTLNLHQQQEDEEEHKALSESSFDDDDNDDNDDNDDPDWVLDNTPPTRRTTTATPTPQQASSRRSSNNDNMTVTACTNCETINTPLWRRNDRGEPLCNACGLFLKLHGMVRPLSLKTDVIKKRNRQSSSITKKKKRRANAASKK